MFEDVVEHNDVPPFRLADAVREEPLPDACIRHAHASAGRDRRIGLAIRYIPTYVRQTKVRDSAVLVRGVDRYHHFDYEQRPKADADVAALAAHKDAMDRQIAALYQGTDKTAFRA